MKTNHINLLSINLLSGSTGSAKIASDIMLGSRKSGIETHEVVGYTKDHEITHIFPEKPMGFWYYFWVASNFFCEILRPGFITHQKLKKNSRYNDADIMHFHTIQGGYFDYRDLPLISKEKKIVWTLHDDWFCAGNDTDNSLFPYKTRRSFEKRKSIFANTDMHVVAVSDWMYQKALRSHMFPTDHIHLIRNGIDTSIFYPRDKKESRKILGISVDITMVVSIAGAGRKSKAKGVQYVECLAQEMSSDVGIQFYTLGNSKWNIQGNINEIDFISPEMMSLYFSAADIFLYPTRADSFGLVIAESLACGCPVITFDVGATSELVIDGKTGFLVPFGDYDGLKKAFLNLRANPIKIIPGSLPFDISASRMVQEYIELYNRLLAD